MGGVSSPLTDDAEEALLEAALEPTLEATVFFLSFPSSARLACRAAFEADTILVFVATIENLYPANGWGLSIAFEDRRGSVRAEQMFRSRMVVIDRGEVA